MFKLTILMKMLPVMIKNWRLTIISILSAFIWYQNNSEEVKWGFVTIPYIQAQLHESTTALKESASGNAALADSLDKRNREIVEWKATSKVLTTQNQILTTQIEDVKWTTTTRVAALMRQQTPKDCSAAFRLLSTNIGDLSWDE